MDLVDYQQSVYDKIVDDFQAFSIQLDFRKTTAIPLSALKGDNIIERSSHTPWYRGATMMGFLETTAIEDKTDAAFRYPVQWVNRPHLNFRGFSGTVASGQIQQGDEIRVLPSGELAKIKEIILFESQLERAQQHQSVTITLDREIDVSRGDVFVDAKSPCEVSDQFEANLVWMDQQESYIGRTYLLKIHNITVNATITAIKHKYNINTLDKLSCRSLTMNEIGVVTLSIDKPIAFDPFDQGKQMGAFVLIDRFSNATVSAGMINHSLRRATNIHHHAHEINRAQREQLNGHKGQCFWFTGLSGSGKSTIANAFEKALHKQGVRTYILDGDNVRHGINKDLGFTDADRVENIRRVVEIAKLMVDAGVVVLCSFISPFRAERVTARAAFDAKDFAEIFVDVPLGIAETRDPKGLYKKARRGEIPNFTGINSPYERPQTADLTIQSGQMSVEDAVMQLLKIYETTES